MENSENPRQNKRVTLFRFEWLCSSTPSSVNVFVGDITKFIKKHNQKEVKVGDLHRISDVRASRSARRSASAR